MAKKLLIGVGAVVVLAAAGGYGAYAYYRNLMEQDVQSVLAYVSPSGKATYTSLDYDLFGDTVTLRGVEVKSDKPDVPSLLIDSVSVTNPKRDNVRKVFNPASYADSTRSADMLPLADTVVMEGLKGQNTGPFEVSLAKLVIDQPSARQFAQIPPADLTYLFNADKETLEEYLGSLRYGAVSLENLVMDKKRPWIDGDDLFFDGLFGSDDEKAHIALARITLGPINDSVLMSFDLGGLVIDIEPKAFDGDKKEGQETKIGARLGGLTLEKIDLKPWLTLNSTIEAIEDFDDIEKSGVDFIRSIGIGKILIDDYSTSFTEVRPPYPWESGGYSYWDDDDDEDDAADETAQLTRTMNFTMKKVALDSFEKGVLKSFRIEDVDFAFAVTPEKFGRENMAYRQGLVLVEGMDVGGMLAPLMGLDRGYYSEDAMMASIFEQFFSPVQAGKVELRDIRLASPEVGELGLKELVGTSTYTDGILTRSEGTLTDFFFTLPEKIRSPFDPRRALVDMGYKSIQISSKAMQAFNPEDQSYKVEFDIDAKDMGLLKATVDLGKYPRTKSGEDSADTPASRREQWRKLERLFKSIELRSAELTYTDASLFEKIFTYGAKETEVSVEEIKAEIIEDMRDGIERQKRWSDEENPSFPRIEQAVAEIAKFVRNPATITFALKPPQPVLFGDADDHSDEPEPMFEFLGLVTTYTERTTTP